MKRIPKWQKLLTAKERKHLREMDAGTLAAFRRTAAEQARMRRSNGGYPVIEPCWECKFIARKLGIPT